jgi:hydrogenase maturation protease
VNTRVVVAGYGNPLRRDDGAGWRVAEVLASRWPVTVLTGQQPLPEWSTTLAEADVAYFVDAGVSPRTRLRLRRLARDDTQVLDGHALAAGQVLALAQALYGRCPNAYLLELPVYDLGFGDTLSAPAAAIATRAVRLLDRRLAALP